MLAHAPQDIGYYVWISANQTMFNIDADCSDKSAMSTILQAAVNEIVYMVRFSSSTKGKNYFVCGPTAQRTEDKNELWAIIRNDNEVYAHLISDTGLVEDL